MLQRHDFAVEMVDSAEAALTFLQENRPDAIFMDHLMKGMDGLEATALIKQNPATKDIPVVMCTSNEGGEYTDKAKSVGALGTLLKPPAPEKLEEVIVAVEHAIEETLQKDDAVADAGEQPVPSDVPSAVSPVPARKAIPEQDQLEQMWEQLQPRIMALVSKELLQLEKRTVGSLRQLRDEMQQSVRQAGDSASEAAAESSSRLQRMFDDQIEKQASDLQDRLDELKSTLLEDVLGSKQLNSLAAEAAEAAESVANRVAESQVQRIAPAAAERALLPIIDDKLVQLEEKLEQMQQETANRAGLFAAAAAAAGVGVAVVLFLLT